MSIERRQMTAELRMAEADGGGQPRRTITGYAAVFGKDSLPLKLADGSQFIERIERGAFKACLAGSPDVVARIDHEGGTSTIGRTTNGTLELAEDEVGLRYTVHLPDTTAARDLAVLIDRGDISQSSYGFKVLKGGERWVFEKGREVRLLSALSVVEVSPSAMAQYPDTTVAMRSREHAAAVRPATAPRRTSVRLAIAERELELRGVASAPSGVRDCHGAQLFGPWACEPGRMMAMAEALDGMSLAAVKAAAKPGAGGEDEPMYARGEGGVAMISLSGPMTKHTTSFQSMFGGASTLRARRALRAAAADASVPGIVLRIDSPGGTIAGTADLVDDVRAASQVKPVVAFIEDLGASAAYWAASGARTIIANRTALVGSIGVISSIRDTSQADERLGIKVHVFRTAPLKAAPQRGEALTDAVAADIQREVDSIGRAFFEDVQAARGLSDEALSAVTTGQVWLAPEALSLGLIDSIGSLDDAFRAARQPASAAETI